jgi:hypothetical protein
VNLQFFRRPSAKVQDLVSPAGFHDIVLQMSLTKRVKEIKDSDKICLPSAVWANDHVDRSEF